MTAARFLEAIDLSQYSSAFADQGHDNLEDIWRLTLEETLEIDGMKPGHAKRINEYAKVWSNEQVTGDL